MKIRPPSTAAPHPIHGPAQHWGGLRMTGAGLALAAMLGAGPVHALGLGRMTVMSSLGEPLRAEIDIADIQPDELASLQTKIATAEAYRAAGVEYLPAVGTVQVQLLPKSNGKYTLRLASDKPLNEPFVDVMLDLQWATGRLSRDYTLLLDPPANRTVAKAVAPVAPQLTASAAPAAAETAVRPATPVAPVAPVAAVAAPAPAEAVAASATKPAPASNRDPAPRTAVAEAPVTDNQAVNRSDVTPSAKTSAPAAAKPAPVKTATAKPANDKAGSDRVVVKSGETATAIVMRKKTPTVSLDQMLVALLNANPDAFIKNNVNRLRAGAVIDVPSAEQATALSAKAATETIVAQSRDFDEYRRQIAGLAPLATAVAQNRAATGKIEGSVADARKAAKAEADRLLLAKAAAKEAAKAEVQAKAMGKKDSDNRMAELTRNIDELKGLGLDPKTPATTAVAVAPLVPSAPKAASTPSATSVQTAAASPATATPSVASGVSTPLAAEAPAVAAASAVSSSATVVTGAAAVAVEPLSVAATTTKPVVPGPTVTASLPPGVNAVTRPGYPDEPGALHVVDSLLANPVLPGVGAGMVLLLAGLAVVQTRRRRLAEVSNTMVDSSFLESRMQPDSFFGGTGQQNLETAEGAPASSVVYSPSQLDAAGDVDPVAEADVYLAYGRALQAEEILKEAIRHTPHRVSVYTKLLEIYAKRHDFKAFENYAQQAKPLLADDPAGWERVCALGRSIDKDNALYAADDAPNSVLADDDFASVYADDAVAAQMQRAAPADLRDIPVLRSEDRLPEFPVDQASMADASTPATAGTDAAVEPVESTTQIDVGLDLLPTMDAADAAAAAQAVAEPSPLDGDDLDDFEFDASPPASTILPVADTTGDEIDAALERAVTELDRHRDEAVISLDLPTATSKGSDFLDSGPDRDVAESLDAFFNAVPDDAPNTSLPSAHGLPSMMDFDMSSLSLDLGPSKGDEPAPAHADQAAPNGDDVATKLALAEEFHAIGDDEGARSLVKEVLAVASGSVKIKAQRFLADLT